jgi:hypothetical protein
MATFATATTRGTVLDMFVTPELLQKVARTLSEELGSFRTHILVSRRLGSRAGETTAPTAQGVRRLGQLRKLETLLEDDLARAYKRAVPQVVPQARRASGRALSAFALEGGATLRLDLASGAALPIDVILTFLCRPSGGVEATLQVWSGPLTGCSQQRAPVLVPLKDQQAAVIPALWPAELLPRWNAESQDEPLFAVVILVAVETS